MSPDERADTPALGRLARGSWIAAGVTVVVGALAAWSVLGLVIVPAAVGMLVAFVASALGAHVAARRFRPRVGRRQRLRHLVAALPYLAFAAVVLGNVAWVAGTVGYVFAFWDGSGGPRHGLTPQGWDSVFRIGLWTLVAGTVVFPIGTVMQAWRTDADRHD